MFREDKTDSAEPSSDQIHTVRLQTGTIRF